MSAGFRKNPKNTKIRRLYEARNSLKSLFFCFFVFFPGIGRADGKGRQKKEVSVSAFFGRLQIPRSPS